MIELDGWKSAANGVGRLATAIRIGRLAAGDENFAATIATRR